MIKLYLDAIKKDIYYYQKLGCSKDLIAKKLRRKYQSKLSDKQTQNMHLIIEFILYKKPIHINGKMTIFLKESLC